MNDESQKHHRRSIRLKGYDYTQPGAYFVTICAYQRAEIFGEVVAGEMKLNPLGEIVREEWLKTADIRSNVKLYEDELAIMPNHAHGIIWIVGTVGATIESTIVGATRWVAPTAPVNKTIGSRTLIPGSIGAILAQFKSVSAKRINLVRGTPGVSVWQRNYYEHIIRNEKELENIWNYIDTNPLRWLEDQLHPAAMPNSFNQDRA